MTIPLVSFDVLFPFLEAASMCDACFFFYHQSIVKQLQRCKFGETLLDYLSKETTISTTTFPAHWQWKTSDCFIIFKFRTQLQAIAPLVVLIKVECDWLTVVSSLERNNCTRWKQRLRTLRWLDDNNVAVIYCGCSRNSEYGINSRQWPWKGAIKVNSGAGGKWLVCVVNVSGFLLLLFFFFFVCLALRSCCAMALQCHTAEFSHSQPNLFFAAFLLWLHHIGLSAWPSALTSPVSLANYSICHFAEFPFAMRTIPPFDGLWFVFLTAGPCYDWMKWDPPPGPMRGRQRCPLIKAQHGVATWDPSIYLSRKERGREKTEELTVLWKFSCISNGWCQLTKLFYFSFSSREGRVPVTDSGENILERSTKHSCRLTDVVRWVIRLRRTFWILNFISIAPLAVVKLLKLCRGSFPLLHPSV